MQKVKVLTDSCADITTELLEKYDIDYVHNNIIRDGVVSPALLSWTPKQAHEMYDAIRGGNRILSTPVPEEEFLNAFSYYGELGYDMIYIGCSIKQTKSVPIGHMASKKYMKAHPGIRIACIDSLNASYGVGMVAIEAAKLAMEGKGIDEIVEYISSIRKNVLQYVTVHTLEYMRRAGRISASTAFFGNLMGVKPIIIADASGTQVGYEKVKGRKASLDELVALMSANITDAENQTIYLVHADCSPEDITYLASKVQLQLKCRDIFIGYIGPIIGASVGPDAIGIFAFGKEVTYRAEDN